MTVQQIGDLPADARKRGITTNVMRKLEPALVSASAEVNHNGQADWTAALQSWVSEHLPDSPRADPARYYTKLLELFDIIDALSSEPINELAGVLQIPKGTAKSRVRIARSQAKDPGSGMRRRRDARLTDPGA